MCFERDSINPIGLTAVSQSTSHQIPWTLSMEGGRLRRKISLVMPRLIIRWLQETTSAVFLLEERTSAVTPFEAY